MTPIQSYSFFAGSYAQREEAGIYRLKLDGESGQLTAEAALSGIANPSFVEPSGDRGVLYAVSETAEGRVFAVAYDERESRFSVLNDQPTHGADPCHLQLSRDGSRLFVANYTGGNVNVFPVRSDGTLGPASDNRKHEGSSVNPERQGEPHPHSAFVDPAGERVLAVDLGTDRITAYRVSEAGKLEPSGEIKTAPGAGPRHVAFHPHSPVVYCVNELNNTVAAYRYPVEGSAAEPLQQIGTLPEGWTGESYCADLHVHPNGRMLYASNRGHDSIATFDVSPDGRLALRGHAPSGGRWPRSFCVTPDGKFLFAANQHTDNICVFRVEGNGELTRVSVMDGIGKPVCVRNA